jgi:hypothetical protein
MNRLRLMVLFFLLLGMMGGLWASETGPQSSSAKSAKTVVVRNGKIPALIDGKRTTLTLKHDLTLGEDQENPDYTFSVLNYFAVDDQENIFVMDQKENKVRIFGPSGRLLSSFGRKGQGPGEFQTPSRIGFDREGDLYIHDLLGRRLQYFSRNGKWIRDLSFAGLDLSDVLVDSQGRFYAQNETRSAASTRFELTRFDAGIRPLAVIASLERMRAKLIDMADMGLPQIYICLNPRDELVWAKSTEYVIHIHAPDGKPVREIIRDHPPTEVTAAAKARFNRLTDALERKFPLPMPKRTYVFPKFFPEIQALFADDEGRIFVRTYDRNPNGEILYDVFNAEGTFVSRFSLPEREEAMVAKKGRLYVIIRDRMEGDYLLKRYSMTWHMEPAVK